MIIFQNNFDSIPGEGEEVPARTPVLDRLTGGYIGELDHVPYRRPPKKGGGQ